ncbi:MAG: hypothetical protein EXR07_12185 [Acetobacteraceae bacterium]|nr:hypothetical protein [Acetobacteraceae bacterium]
MDDPEPKPNSGYAAAVAEIREILTDAVIVACVVLAIYGVDVLSHTLVPPDGPVFFRHTRFEFPFQWMIDASHIANFGTFVVRVVRRMWR